MTTTITRVNASRFLPIGACEPVVSTTALRVGGFEETNNYRNSGAVPWNVSKEFESRVFHCLQNNGQHIKNLIN